MDPGLPTEEPPLSARTKRALLLGLVPGVAAVHNAVVAVLSLRARRLDARRLLGLAALDLLATVALVVLWISPAAHPAPSSPERQSVGLRVSTVDGGARVDAVVSGGPAEKGGVRVGDVIDEVDGESLTSVEALAAAMQKVGPHALGIRRGSAHSKAVVHPMRASVASKRMGLSDVWVGADKDAREAAREGLLFLAPPAALLAAIWALTRRTSFAVPGLVVGALLVSWAITSLFTVAMERFLHGVTWAGVLTSMLTWTAAILAGAAAMWTKRERLRIAAPGSPRATGGWQPSGLRARKWARAGVFAALLLAPRTLTIGAFLARFVNVPKLGTTPVDSIQFMPAKALPFFVLGAVVVAPMAEELLFRGVLHGWLRSFLSTPAAIAIGAATFALCHLQYGAQIVAVFGIGCVLGWVREGSGTLRAPMAVHGAYNAVSVALGLLRWLFG